MAWRGLHLSQSSRLSLADGQIVVVQDRGETRLPLEDIAWVIIDTPQASLSTALLSACATAGIALIVTDARHMPNGMLLPFHTHHRQAAVASWQIRASTALRGRLWQAIIRAKITNQAAILQKRSGDPAPVRAMARHVQPADPDNVEARAAREYWSTLFKNFTRDDDRDQRNAMLNYGYAVLRAAVARALVAAGLLPAIGLHHASQLNPFNLADDLIEPFRPIIDLAVCRLADNADPARSLTLGQRQELAAVLLESVKIDNQDISILVATEMAAASLVRALEASSAKLLLLPSICGA